MRVLCGEGLAAAHVPGEGSASLEWKFQVTGMLIWKQLCVTHELISE